MEAIDLKKMKPQKAPLKVGEQTFMLRPVTLNDWIWMQKRFGDKIDEKLQAMPFHELCVIIFRLLDNAGKKHFQARQVKDTWDDDGRPIESMEMTGPEVLASEMAGISAMTEIVEAFRKAMGIDAELEKKLETAEKKIPRVVNQ